MAWWEWNATGNPAHPHVASSACGLTRQGATSTIGCGPSEPRRVICPDVVGRGESDWLADPMAYQVPVYAADMLTLLAQLHQQAPMAMRWTGWGTSMGGLIGMGFAACPICRCPAPCGASVLNDVGPRIEWAALVRIGDLPGPTAAFRRLALQPRPIRWADFEQFSARTPPSSGWICRAHGAARTRQAVSPHYDPAIAVPFVALTPEAAARGAAVRLWQLYDQISAHAAAARRADSDLLSCETAQAMDDSAGQQASATGRGRGVGHAPHPGRADQVGCRVDFPVWAANGPLRKPGSHRPCHAPGLAVQVNGRRCPAAADCTASRRPRPPRRLARARAFAEPLRGGETLETGENTLAMPMPWPPF